jgi:hypothetical protein
MEAAMEADIEAGGWCPQGRAAEDGVIPDRYPLTELPGGGYQQRTLQNVLDSDATAIICSGNPAGGTLLTIQYCKKNEKKYILIDAATRDIQTAAGMLTRFVREEGVEVLNVAGPRARKDGGIYEYTRQVIKRCLI